MDSNRCFNWCSWLILFWVNDGESYETTISTTVVSRPHLSTSSHGICDLSPLPLPISKKVSNLTFGSVQQIAAETIGVSENAMLALQAVGASAGNGICLNNIISACTVTGLVIGEGKIIAKTAKFVLAFIVIATLIMLAFLFGEA